MTRQNRKSHLLMWLVLAPLVVLGIVAALAVRPAPTPATIGAPASPAAQNAGGAP